MTEANRALRQRERLACALGTLLIILVMGFCLLSVLAPGFMGFALIGGSIITRGIAFAFFIVAAVISGAVLYSARLNRMDAGTGAADK